MVEAPPDATPNATPNATIAGALRQATRRLEASSDTARLDAELLMAHALGASRSDLLLRHMKDAVPEGFAPLVERRARCEPVAYIVGRQDFYGLEFAVDPSVLIPRGDSETLIEAAREAMGERVPRRILDLGTGSGALLIAALDVWPDAQGLGLDRSEEALQVARRNGERILSGDAPAGAERALFEQRDWRERDWREDLGRFDLILCNPPYVETGAALDPDVSGWEPHGALFAGPEGLDDYRVLIAQVPDVLAPGGTAVFEIGATQAEAVAAIAAEAGLTSELRRDLAGRPRALVLRLTLGK